MCSIAGVGNGTGAVQGWGRACVSGASCRVAGDVLCPAEDVTCGEAEPKCNSELCLSWLLAVGAGKDMGTALGHCWQGLAALRCSSAAAPCGAVSVPKGEMHVGSFPTTTMAARARAVLSLGWSFCSLQPVCSPGWSCTPLPACCRFSPCHVQ